MRTYTINESTARLSHEMRSFDDYEKGSATAGYNADVAEAAAILERVKALCSKVCRTSGDGRSRRQRITKTDTLAGQAP